MIINIPNINPILYNEQNGGFNQKIPYIKVLLKLKVVHFLF